ncbi:MAG: PIN domain-containing protein [Marinoscillum sp.]
MRTGERYLVDTNIIIDYFRGDSRLASRFTNHTILIPSIVVGELFYGANLSAKRRLRVIEVSNFIQNHIVVDVNAETSEFYGSLKAELKQAGTPIPENDVWIAALSKQHSLILATKDNHFTKAKSIKVIFW